MIVKIKKLIESGKDEVKTAKGYMITEHEHNDRGSTVMLLSDYDSLLDNYERFIECIKQIVDGE